MSQQKSYSMMFLEDRAVSFDATKQEEIEEIIFDYSKESYFVFKDALGEDVKVLKKLTFDPKRCDLVGRDEPPCTKCIDSCEYSALIFDKSAKTLGINHSACVFCAKCVGACPTGALQSSKFGFDSFCAVLEAAKGSILLFAQEADLLKIKAPLPTNTLIVIVEEYSFLNELYLCIAAFKSGGKIAFVDKDGLPCELINAIEAANFVTGAVTGKNALFFLNNTLEPDFFEPISIRLENLGLRGAFSACVKAYGSFYDATLSGSLSMTACVKVLDNCTVCMGCAFVCKSGAFKADEAEGALKLNSSLCTACGYCESVCPEKSIVVNKGSLGLRESDFEFKTVAKDELFYCVECGKPFATKKAIEKITAVFAPLTWDADKQRTLFCCKDCKPKVMLNKSLQKYAEAAR